MDLKIADKFRGHNKKLLELTHQNDEEKENYCNSRTGKFLNSEVILLIYFFALYIQMTIFFYR